MVFVVHAHTTTEQKTRFEKVGENSSEMEWEMKFNILCDSKFVEDGWKYSKTTTNSLALDGENDTKLFEQTHTPANNQTANQLNL